MRKTKRQAAIDPRRRQPYPSQGTAGGGAGEALLKAKQRAGVRKMANLLIMDAWKAWTPSEPSISEELSSRKTTTVGESIRAIHDVLEMARTVKKADVSILCSSLSSELRDDAWSKHTKGQTFGGQLMAALNNQAKVRILVVGSLQTVFPLAPSLLPVLIRYSESSSLDLVLTGTDKDTVKFFSHFPHFTRTDVPCAEPHGRFSFAHLEWGHPKHLDWKQVDAKFDGEVVAGKEDAVEPLAALRKRFDNIFNAYAVKATVQAIS